MDNIRNSVSRREIIRYLKLREKRLQEGIMQEGRSEEEKKPLRIRQGEICRLINLISQDEIREDIKSMYKHFNYPKKELKEDIKKGGFCPDCGGLIEIRNPTGKCDHLYYPENKK